MAAGCRSLELGALSCLLELSLVSKVPNDVSSGKPAEDGLKSCIFCEQVCLRLLIFFPPLPPLCEWRPGVWFLGHGNVEFVYNHA